MIENAWIFLWRKKPGQYSLETHEMNVHVSITRKQMHLLLPKKLTISISLILLNDVEWLYWGLRAFLHEADLTRIRSLRLKIWRKSAGFSFPWEKVGTGWTEQGMCFMPGAKTSWSPRNHSNINTYCWWNHSIWFTLGSCQENTWQSIYLFTWIELYMGIPLMNFSHCPKKHPCLKAEVVLFRISVQKTWIKPNP